MHCRHCTTKSRNYSNDETQERLNSKKITCDMIRYILTTRLAREIHTKLNTLRLLSDSLHMSVVLGSKLEDNKV